jgi:hypothetical protein
LFVLDVVINWCSENVIVPPVVSQEHRIWIISIKALTILNACPLFMETPHLNKLLRKMTAREEGRANRRHVDLSSNVIIDT